MKNLVPALLLAVVPATASGQLDATIRASSTPSGAAGNGGAASPAVAADGSCIVFTSYSDDLMVGDGNFTTDVFVFDLATRSLSRVSVDSLGDEANGGSAEGAALSADGRFVAFASVADNLAFDPNGAIQDIFLHDRTTGATTLVSVDPAGKGADDYSGSPSLSDDGDRIVFYSKATNLVTPSPPATLIQIYLHEISAGVTTLVSTDDVGHAANRHSYSGVISGDGTTVAFRSNATNLPDSGSDEFHSKCFVRNLASGLVTRIDIDADGAWSTGNSDTLGISTDGTQVLLRCDVALVPEDGNGRYDYYVRDLAAGTIERVSVATGGAEIHPYYGPGFIGANLSADGRFVAFASDASDVIPGHPTALYDVFVHDRVTGITNQASLGTLDELGSEGSFTGGISRDGRVIAFSSFATEFAANDGNNTLDVFVRERALLPATAVHYGTGFPGRGGAIPTIEPDHAPWRGGEIVFGVDGSSDSYTIALLLVGLARASIPTNVGGTLLVDFELAVPFALTPFGGVLVSQVPVDWWANGLVVDLQVIELDPWAAKDVSFSDGLELTIGDG